MIEWQYFPKSRKAPDLAVKVVQAFESALPSIDSEKHNLNSNQVLAKVADGLSAHDFQVETGKKKAQMIPVAVLYGPNGKAEKSFHVDAFHAGSGFVIEVEAGRGVENNQFLKDLFEACMMHDVNYLAIVVRRLYHRKKKLRSCGAVLRYPLCESPPATPARGSLGHRLLTSVAFQFLGMAFLRNSTTTQKRCSILNREA